MQKTTEMRTEIDFMELLARIYHQIRKNFVVAILLPLLGIAVAYWTAAEKEKRYEARVMVSTSVLSEIESNFLIGEMANVNKVAGVGPQSVGLLRSVEKIKIEKGAGDMVYIALRFQGSSRVLFDSLKNAVVQYITTSESFVRNSQMKKDYHKEMIAKIDSELARFERFEDRGEFKRGFWEPSGVLERSIEVFDLRLKHNKQLESSGKVYWVQGIQVRPVVTGGSQMVRLLIGLGSGIFLFFVFIFIKYFHRYYQQFKSL